MKHSKNQLQSDFKRIFDKRETMLAIALALSAKQRRCHMEKINISPFFEFAARINWVESLKEGDTYEDRYDEFLETIEYLQGIEGLLKNRFKISLPALEEFRDVMRELYLKIEHTIFTEKDKSKYDPNGNFQEIFDDDEIWLLKVAYEKFSSVFLAELNSLHTYILASSGVYGLDELLEEKEIFLPEHKKNVPAQCEADFREAGKALVLRLPLATSFHLFRAIESILFAYGNELGLFIGQLKPAERNWGIYLKKLGDVGCDQAALSLLTQVKDEYRNPLVHPEATISYEEVFALFGLTYSLILRLSKLILIPLS